MKEYVEVPDGLIRKDLIKQVIKYERGRYEELVEQFNHYEPCYLSVETDGIICDEQESCKQCIKQYFEKKAEENK